MQGVVKLYDPATRDGVIITDVDLAEYDLAPAALEGSVFRMLRPGQRVVFDLDEVGQAIGIRLGSEVDMATPAWLEPDSSPAASHPNDGHPNDGHSNDGHSNDDGVESP